MNIQVHEQDKEENEEISQDRGQAMRLNLSKKQKEAKVWKCQERWEQPGCVGE